MSEMEQNIFHCSKEYSAIDSWIESHQIKRILLVCGSSVKRLYVDEYFSHLPERKGIQVTRFSDFIPNPDYESVVKGVGVFHAKGSDAIAAVGGGSAIDVAKCIKLFADMEPGKNYLEQTIIPNHIPFLVMPTTAGTGSESTRFAVIYYKGVKQSVSDLSCIPDTVIFDSSVLETLPLYQKKAAMMDAFCHALESFWSVNSTAQSKAFSREAIRLILENADAYLINDPVGNNKMLLASNLSGKAINITQTTAGHAMCYKITGLFGAAHGHAAALCCRVLFPHMIGNLDKCIDPRGKAYLDYTLYEIADAMGCEAPREAADLFTEFFTKLELSVPEATEEQFSVLTGSVNLQRLKNHPVLLDEKTISLLYHKILKEKTHER